MRLLKSFSLISLINSSCCVLFAQPARHLAVPRMVAQQKSADQTVDLEQLRAEAERGNALAQLKLARIYQAGTGVSRDNALAAMWYRRAAEQGNSDAQDSLGQKYLVGEGLKRNLAEALEWFHKSARQGNPSAMYHLGASYYNGDGVEVDDAQAYAWFRLAKEAGYAEAVEAIARVESELKPQTITVGLENIAEMYEKGGDLPENRPEAARWWSAAAMRGDEDANVGMAFNTLRAETALRHDLNKARQACMKAAEHRNHRAEYCLGYLYQHGLGVAPDAKRARRWYELAADKGQLEATRTLAVMEAAGEGGKVDRVAAFLLYARLLEMRDKDALRSLSVLRSEITPKEWKQLQQPLLHMRIDPAKLDNVLQHSEAPTSR